MSAVNTSNKLRKRAALTDTAMLLMITVIVFIAMYVCAVLFIGKGFAKPQSFLNILNENAALIVLSCGMSLVMI
ncbi:MAG TPA: sugar ABC transporter permease YjfF, partial [Clostridiales bacterium]|nr:sugar ABC transporter permease YjfF [Clostridiales bacterium]